MAARSAAAVSPSNGKAPVKSSCKMMPSAQTSDRTSARFALRICSGGMYAGEPNTSCVSVSDEEPPSSDTLEMPKSSTLMSGEPSDLVVRNRFDGLRSR